MQDRPRASPSLRLQQLALNKSGPVGYSPQFYDAKSDKGDMGSVSKFQAVVALLLFPVASQAAENWSQLKLGMSVEETIAALGTPLMRTAGRGFETWTYDKGGDVLIYGSLIAWTAPAAIPVAVRRKDIWSENPKLTYVAALALVPAPIPAYLRRSTGIVSRTPTFFLDFYRR